MQPSDLGNNWDGVVPGPDPTAPELLRTIAADANFHRIVHRILALTLPFLRKNRRWSSVR